MGHYASEMDPGWGDSIDRTNRQMRIRDELGAKSLSSFRVEDLPLLNKLFSYDSLNDREFEYLKRLIDKNK